MQTSLSVTLSLELYYSVEGSSLFYKCKVSLFVSYGKILANAFEAYSVLYIAPGYLL
ncbi:protein of unknown function [Cyanobium sp. NIES-981]|nr:protein of unknown function [Cyanobium sp. NIES-981]